ncbi:galactan export ABC transporter permease subunit Wzm/RfbD [Jongsikchunia kroppenstedtii]|uniref:galactan export ABC transporter permease subunit Wzm/RfbD n=1 Tax=Jongsikchunia kroppenstedtii TaxID=1121721 RepID=UPI00035CB1AC|nr:ABC transporter permease [Jongsikchunia kroppenstedtii]
MSVTDLTDQPSGPPPPAVTDSRSYRRAWGDLVAGYRNHELWLHLGWQDIKQRYRRSLLGPLWITLATAVTSVAMGLLYSELFHMDLKTFLPHLLLGFIFWNFLADGIKEGADVFASNDGLLKQIPAPLSVHVYRLVWRQSIILLHNVPIYIAILIIYPQPINWTMILVFPGMFLLAMNVAWMTVVFGILSTRFRDISQLLNTLVQLVFFMTPIIWTTDSLKKNGNGNSARVKLVELNPALHYLDVTRGPLMGQSIAFYHWAIVIGCTAVGCAAAMFILRNYRARVAYWV